MLNSNCEQCGSVTDVMTACVECEDLCCSGCHTDQVLGICEECSKKQEPDEEEAESAQPLTSGRMGFHKAGDLQSDDSQLEDLTFEVCEQGDDEIIELAE